MLLLYCPSSSTCYHLLSARYTSVTLPGPHRPLSLQSLHLKTFYYWFGAPAWMRVLGNFSSFIHQHSLSAAYNARCMPGACQVLGHKDRHRHENRWVVLRPPCMEPECGTSLLCQSLLLTPGSHHIAYGLALEPSWALTVITHSSFKLWLVSHFS